MSPERTTVINGHTVSEYYWARSYPVYVDNRLQEGQTYEDVCERLSAEAQAAPGVAVPATRLGKPYLDGLIDRLLRPLPSMPARDAQKLMGEAAEMIHLLASRNAGVMVLGQQEESQEDADGSRKDKT